jgi:hypothetical protein
MDGNLTILTFDVNPPRTISTKSLRVGQRRFNYRDSIEDIEWNLGLINKNLA